jgi:hypothetical protein
MTWEKVYYMCEKPNSSIDLRKVCEHDRCVSESADWLTLLELSLFISDLQCRI